MSPQIKAILTVFAIVLFAGCKSAAPLRENSSPSSSGSAADQAGGPSPQPGSVQASLIQQPSPNSKIGIDVKDVEVQLVTPPRGYLVFGKLICTGNRSLRNIELTIRFLDENGQRLGEQKDHPLAASEEIKPGDSKGIKISIKPPDGWKSKVEVKVTNFDTAS